MKILISDMGGVIYSFDPSFDPQKHEAEFNRAMIAVGKSESNLSDQLQDEWEAVNRGLLQVYPNKTGIDNFVKNLNWYHGVIVATSKVETTKWILDKFTIPLDNLDIFDISIYGSKKDKNAWYQIFKDYQSIDVIVEDSEKNLTIAKECANELGFGPKTYTSMPLLNQ